MKVISLSGMILRRLVGSNNAIKFLQVVRANSARPGVFISVWIFLITLVITLISDYYVLGDVRGGKLFLLFTIVIFLGLSILSFLLSGRLILYTLNAEDYAKIMLSGRPFPEIICVVAEGIIELCDYFLDANKEVLKLNLKQEEKIASELRDNRYSDYALLVTGLGQDWREHRSEYEKVVRKMNVAIYMTQRKAERVEQMKILTSEILGVSQRKLCDHIFQFSVMLYVVRIEKYRENILFLLDMFNEDREIMYNKAIRVRICGVISQNYYIQKTIYERVRRARELVDFSDLHTDVIATVSRWSASGGVRRYAQLIKKVALQGRERINKGNNTASEIARLDRKLWYIMRKQEAYPGYDLHANIIRIMEEEILDNPKSDQSKYNNLTIIKNSLECLRDHRRIYIDQEALRGTEKDSYYVEHKDKILQIVNLLLDINLIVDSHITNSVDKIVNNYKSIYDHYFSDVKGSKFIVIHGYSKTVRQIIKHSITQSNKGHYIFSVLTENGTDVEARIMRHELYKDIRIKSRRDKNMASAHIEVLYSLLEEDSGVMFLLGAECFDRKRRIVHPEGITDILRRTREYAKLKKCKKPIVVVAAEHYKLQENLIDSELYDDHFNRIVIYDQDDIDEIVTNRGFMSEA